MKRALFAVVLGGALGTLLRVEILQWGTSYSTSWVGYASLSHSSSVSWTVLIPWRLIGINSVGVALATWLLRDRLHDRAPNDPWRLLLITGLLGGLTSYSTLISDVILIHQISNFYAAVVLLGSVAVGLIAAWFGSKVARS